MLGRSACKAAAEQRGREGQRAARARRPVQQLQRRRSRSSISTSTATRPRRWASRSTTSFDTLQVYLGSAYVNDFTLFGRNWQVNVQADAAFRISPEDIGRLEVRNATGDMVPLAHAGRRVRDSTGPAIVNRYNMFPSAEINGSTAPGISSGPGDRDHGADRQAGAARGHELRVDRADLAADPGGQDGGLRLPAGRVFVFLVLAAQYESWSLPLAIILIVPMCLLAAIAGVWSQGMDNNIFTQIGLVVLIGLAAKNAILIVEFAKARQDEGSRPLRGHGRGLRARLRPILMTSFAFPRRGAAGARAQAPAPRCGMRWASPSSAACSA